VGENTLDSADAWRLASALVALVETAKDRIRAEGRSTLVDKISAHVGCPLAEILTVGMEAGSWEHVNLQRGVDAYLAEHSPDAEWFGVSGPGRGHQDVIEMLAAAERLGTYQLGSVDYSTVAVGPDDVTEAVQLGLVATVAPDGAPVVLSLRGPSERHPMPNCSMQILAAQRESATAVRDRIDELMRQHNAFRGAVLQLDMNEHRGNELLSFLVRPELTADQVVLPDGVLETVERHVVRSREHNDRLIAHGQHLKRGVLLYGPPGTGKTHTVRYLLSRLTEATVVVLSGRALRLLPAAAAMVRRQQPSVLVIEDVDLIAQDRSIGPAGSGPLLFELLNRIDGVDADADVTFVLTTNRVDVLEHALADRPGRIDLAIEIPKPGPRERLRLLHLYAADVELDLPDPTALVEALDGVTASFVRELIRRAVLDQIHHDRIVLTEAALRSTLDELASQRHELTSRILGRP
jgi:hypothetical protein